MKTLEELKLDKHKTGNFADYVTKTLICCGWMDIHDDTNSLGPTQDPVFRVKPLYWDDEAVFVSRSVKHWYTLSKQDFLAGKSAPGILVLANLNVDSEKYFTFDARKLHGLLPKELALKINDEFLHTDEYKTFVKDFCKGVHSYVPRLVWSWKE